ncbi:MAG: Nif3-like dinuclear metal center hexameric protein [Clostridia bacterium]|nr:Nif3-like dinuclear metal center hexameric protein [Clostridia bacterium]
MTVREIYEYINTLAPFDTAEAWDNSGFLVGNEAAEVKKAVVCLDVTSREVGFAVKENAELIISHHPVIFKAQKKFTSEDISYTAAVNGISIISAHTNLDKAVGGVNDSLCDALRLSFVKCDETVCGGFLNIVSLKEAMSASQFAVFVKNSLGGAVSYVDGGKSVTKVGVCSGAGADFISEAALLGCDAFLTGEASYHEFLDASADGISLFAAGHYETEAVVVKSLAERLREKFSDVTFMEFTPGSVIFTEN